MAREGNFTTTGRLIDLRTGAETCRLDLRGVSFYGLTPDGRSLFLVTFDASSDEKTISCYDVPPRRAWFQIIAILLGLGMLLLALRYAGKLRRLRPSACVQNPQVDARPRLTQ